MGLSNPHVTKFRTSLEGATLADIVSVVYWVGSTVGGWAAWDEQFNTTQLPHASFCHTSPSANLTPNNPTPLHPQMEKREHLGWAICQQLK